MMETWRWFGPIDRIPLAHIAQTGARGVVTALHDIPYGDIWPRSAIAERKAEIAAAGLTWEVVESLPVHERIKRGEGDLTPLFDAYRLSLQNLAAEGIRTVCYNFMPLLDWTRTTLNAPVPGGASALRFDAMRMAAFDVVMLAREGAEDDHAPDTVARARRWMADATDADRATLLDSIMAGLPGAYARYDIAGLRAALAGWQGATAHDLCASLARFLAEVVPTAEELGVRLCIHPDDPPRPILGLPRIVSTEADIADLLCQVDSPANGLTLCSGSLGAHPENDVPGIAARFAERIAFAHLRNTTRAPDGSFEEAAHLDGDTDMPTLCAVLAAESARRGAPIPYRADHGHEIASDQGAGTHPGYPYIGRLRGLAELRGLFAGLAARADL